jgi:hypothetical protein
VIAGTRRIGIAAALYIAIVAVATLAFAVWRDYLLTGHASRYSFMVLGPAVSLHTHSGLALFLLQSALLIPIIFVAVISRRMRLLAGVVALVVWGYIGWTMATGFLD